MRHYAYTLLGIALLLSASCAKMEENAAPEQPVSFRIKATIDNSAATKTSYTEDMGYKTAHISWMAGDQFKLVVYNNSTHGANFYRCNVREGTINGGFAEFELYGTFDEDNFTRAGYAVYPSDLTIGGNEDDGITVTLPAAYSVSGTDLTQVKVPLIGVEQDVEGHDYDFFNAVGVLKITLTNVPVSARKVVLVSEYDNLSGTFPLDPHNGLKMVDCADGTGGHSITVNISQQTAGSTISVYMPVPVGYISAGAYFEVQTIDGTAIKTTAATTKEIEIKKGHLLPLPAISVEDWVSIGTGKYMDDHGFYYLWTDGRSADDYKDVIIEQHSVETHRYRIYRPYASCVSVETDLPNASDYLYIDLVDATRGIVANHSYKYDNDSKIMFDAPYWGYDDLYHNSRIIKYDGDGNPANIQLAPYYYDFYTANCAQNPKIEIVFPGSTPMMADCFNYANGASASYSDGAVSVNISNALVTGVKVKVVTESSEYAAINAGITALMGGDADLTFTASGSQDLSLPSGTYYMVYMVETDGHGSTFKKGGSFNVINEIPLTADMIYVNTDAGSRDGLKHYDGNGKNALVDGNISTFWHTPWGTRAAVWSWYGPDGAYGTIFDDSYTQDDIYDYLDLDPTYGAYIDIDLGSSKTVSDFQVHACLRNASADFPKHVIIYTSANGSDWTQQAEVANVCSGIAAGAWINPIACSSDAARYIRFSIIENTSSIDLRNSSAQGCTHLAEIKISE